MSDFPELTVSTVSSRLGTAAASAIQSLARLDDKGEDPHFQIGYIRSALALLIDVAARSSSDLAEAYEALQKELEEREALDPRAC